MQDYVLNGVGHGPVGSALNVINARTGEFDAGLLRPFVETDMGSADYGKACATLTEGYVYNSGRKVAVRKKRSVEEWRRRGVDSPTFNATTMLRDDWVQVDDAVERANRSRLSLYDAVRRAKLIGGFNAWTKLTYEYNSVGDGYEVVKSMTAEDPGRDDITTAAIHSVPLPVIHGGTTLPQRYTDARRAGGMAVDAEAIEQITRRGWEMVEKTGLGTEDGVTFGTRSTGLFPHTGTSTEYGLTNFPYRIEKHDLTAPDGTNPTAVVQDVLEMIEQMVSAGFYGPYTLFHSTGYDLYLDSDYFRSGSTVQSGTLRERLGAIRSIGAIERLDYLTTGYQLVLADLTRGHFAAIDGMQPRVVQWTDRGGLIQKLCVLMIQVILIKVPGGANALAPAVHGTTS